MYLLYEAIIVGLLLLLISIPIMHITRNIDLSSVPYLQENKYIKYYISTILIGMVAHFAFEFSGANKWYCTNGNACQQK